MTTKVKVELVQDHMPVRVEVFSKTSDGQERVFHFSELSTVGASTEEYVHSGQTLRIREVTTAELHNKGIA